jgi:hypothetical protein
LVALSEGAGRALVKKPGVQSRALEKKYRRSAMENRRFLQCKALQRREKRRLTKNNGKQWKNHTKNNGNNENTGGVTTT